MNSIVFVVYACLLSIISASSSEESPKEPSWSDRFTYSNNTTDLIINYTLIVALTLVFYLGYPGTISHQRRAINVAGTMIVAFLLQLGVWLMMRFATGVSVVWSFLLGVVTFMCFFQIFESSNEKKASTGIKIALMGAAAAGWGVTVYYAGTMPALTMVAHTVVYLMGVPAGCRLYYNFSF